MSLDILIVDLLEMPIGYKPYSENVYPENVSPEQALKFNNIVPGCAIEDVYEYFNFPKYCKEKDIGMNGFNLEVVDGIEYVVINSYNAKSNSWDNLYINRTEMPVFVEEDSYLFNFNIVDSSGGKYIFNDYDNCPPNQFYTYDELNTFLSYVKKEYHDWYLDLKPNQVIWMNY